MKRPAIPFIVTMSVFVLLFAGCGGGGGDDAASGLYFNADDGADGKELWRHDASSGVTTQVADIYPGSGSSVPADLTDCGGKLYFSAGQTVGSDLTFSGFPL